MTRQGLTASTASRNLAGLPVWSCALAGASSLSTTPGVRARCFSFWDQERNLAW